VNNVNEETARLKTIIANQNRMMIFTADELEMIADNSYTHAQKNGVVSHVAQRLRIWAGQINDRDRTPPRYPTQETEHKGISDDDNEF